MEPTAPENLAAGKPPHPLRTTVLLLLVAGAVAGGYIAGSRSTADRDQIASVDGHPITRSQLDRATEELLWLEGDPGKATPEARDKARKAALEALATDILLDREADSMDPPLSVSTTEIDDRLARLENRFKNKDEFEAAMHSQGIPDRKSLRERLNRQILREKFIEARISMAGKVTDEEARKWFDEHQAELTQPARVRARHVFIPTLDNPPEEAKQKLEAALAALNEKKKDFATLAKELSGDPATKATGGDLGWFSKDRMPADFSAPVFALEPNKPTLVRTKLGWHLVEMTEKKGSGPRTFDQAKPEIIAALSTIKRDKAVKELHDSLNKEAAVAAP